MLHSISRSYHILVASICLMAFVALPAAAQDHTANDPASIPPSARLDGLTMIHQSTNRCASAALTIQLSFFEDYSQPTQAYNDVIRRLNPYGGDVSVRIEEMAVLARERGLSAVVRRGGTIDLLKQLVAAGFPVLIENVYFDGPNGWQDWMSHNRVLVGYDDALQELYFFDPLLGNGDGRGRAMTYDDVDNRWRPFNRDYLVIYEPEDEATLQAILGPNWDMTYNAEWTLQVAEAELNSPIADSFALFNKGWALVQLERYEEAADAFDEARALGLPWRMLWYEFGPFEAYLAVGRYQDVVNLVYEVIQNTDGVEEMYYYIAQAYIGMGQTDRAIANLEAALYRNRYFTEASDLLQSLRG